MGSKKVDEFEEEVSNLAEERKLTNEEYRWALHDLLDLEALRLIKDCLSMLDAKESEK